MNAISKRDKLYTVSRAPIPRLQDNIIRRVDNIRGVTLRPHVINTDNVFGASTAVQESIEETFGKDERFESNDTIRELPSEKDLSMASIEKRSSILRTSSQFPLTLKETK